MNDNNKLYSEFLKVVFSTTSFISGGNQCLNKADKMCHFNGRLAERNLFLLKI